MTNEQSVRDVQMRILQIMKYIDELCRKNGIVYYIMGGTALGAVRHKGFIPWDDDLDIFMTPKEYERFKGVFHQENSDDFVLQEWKTVESHLEYAKVRMNGTTFIEENLKDRADMHHGIYVDIMILHKVPMNRFIQRMVYLESKYVTLYALSQRNWKPKTWLQSIVLHSLKLLPSKAIAKLCYKHIYKYDSLADSYKFCYWITPAKFKQGLFDSDFFADPVDVEFEDTLLLGSRHMEDYLKYRFGDYMQLPPESKRKAAVHAILYDVNKDYKYYL